MTMDAQDFNIVFVGAGNVATHLASACARKGCRIVQVYSRTEASAQTLAHGLGCPYTTDLSEVSPEADLYVVSVKDSALEEVVEALSRYGNPDALYVHTAGSMPMEVWRGKVSRCGVFYPMQSFSKQRAVDFSEVPFFVEADSQDGVSRLKKLAGLLGSKVYEASSEQRKYLHIAAVFASNFTNHMYAVCEHLLAAQGLPFDSMLPLIDETARKVHELSPVEAQTGPARRNDRNVIDRHLDMLKGEPELALIYDLLSQDIHAYESKKQQ